LLCAGKEPTTPPPPLVVPRFTQDVAAEVAAIARALPYRESLGIDSDRVFWIEVSGRERIGVAYAPEGVGGPWWMIAFAGPKKVSRSHIREVVEAFAGSGARWEPAPTEAVAPQLTMVRAKAT
jgi:hypothetical protein